jgi:hypothetical protein
MMYMGNVHLGECRLETLDQLVLCDHIGLAVSSVQLAVC